MVGLLVTFIVTPVVDFRVHSFYRAAVQIKICVECYTDLFKY